MVGAPQLGGDKELLTLHNPGINGLLDTLADFVLIAVAQSRVNVAVADLDGVGNSPGDFARARLPGTETQRRDLRTGVELYTDVTGSHCV